jgi:FtsP/CotA-like multicopper oxidase with cupredoxin domain
MERRHLLMTGLGTMFLMAAAPLIGWSAGEASSASRVRETFREPPVWRSEGGALQRSLEIRRAKTRLGRRQILTLTYEGAIPGPTWLLEPGDHIKVRLINNMTPSASASSEPILPHAPNDHAAGGGGAERRWKRHRASSRTSTCTVCRSIREATVTTCSSASGPGNISTTISRSPRISPRDSSFITPTGTCRQPSNSGTVWGEPSSSRAGSIPCRP